MDWLPYMFLLYLSSIKVVFGLNECNTCSCCRNGADWCQYFNYYNHYCLDGCIDGYYGKRCRHACIDNCLTCSDSISCISCISGYFGKSCEKCPENCLTCSSMNSCNTCRNGFYSGRYLDYDVYDYYSDCRYKCRDKCNTCTSYSECTSCKDGYYNGRQYYYSIFPYSDCRHKCQNNCKSCTSYYTCTECKDGKYNGNNKDCSESCNPICKACTSPNICTKCETGKYGTSCQYDCGLACENYLCDKNTGICKCVFGFQGDKCEQCVSGFYGNYCNTRCSIGCLGNTCNSNGECHCKSGFLGKACDHCVSGTYGYNCDIPCPHGCTDNLCYRNGICTNGCNTGFSLPNCSQCVDGKYGYNCDKNCLINCKRCTTGNSCSLCSPRHWGNTCDPCPSNCSHCSSSTSCSSCDPGFYGVICNAMCPQKCLNGSCNKTNGSCHSCVDGFFGKDCNKACPINCAGSVCSVEGKCDTCVEGYYGENCIAKCSDNCKICHIDNGLCKTCVNGYYGSACELPCPSKCRACYISNGYCTECASGYYHHNQNCHVCDANCKTCKNFNYKCMTCIDGKYGAQSAQGYLHCSFTCSEKCLNLTCDDETGHCSYGCITGFWGNECNYLCPGNCNDGNCFANNGTCISGCKEGYTGSTCNCPANCECNAHGSCIRCKEMYYNLEKKCTCTKEFCADESCASCSNSAYYAESSVCCKCSNTCKQRKCVSAYKCTDGCVDGYRGDDCSGTCKSFDTHCLICTPNFPWAGGKCLQCMSGYYPDSITNRCDGCSQSCVDETCNSVNGTCMTGCKDGYWGDKCKVNCEKDCLKCKQVNGECSVCGNGKYTKTCSEECSANCNATDGVILCDIDDGSCLNGCDTQTKYGKHCANNCNRTCLNQTCNWKTGKCENGCADNYFGELCDKTCSVNCVEATKGGRRCNDVNGHCIVRCKDGFYGDLCKEKCSENCVNTTCDRKSGECSHGCEKGYRGSTCTIALAQTDTGKDNISMMAGAAVGTSVFVIVVIVVIVVIILRKRRRRNDKEEEIDMNETNDNATVTNSEIISSAPVPNDTDAVYAMPNKPKRKVPESRPSEEVKETGSVTNPNYETHKSDKDAVYQNAVVRDSTKAAAHSVPKDNARQLVESAVEIEEDINNVAASRESKTTGSSHCNESEAADTYYNVMAVKKRRIMLDQLAEFVSEKTKEDFTEEFMQLPPGLIKPYTVSQKRENMSKNRYKGIYPYDGTRVVLTGGESDYINASYIDGYNKRQAYIASIGPTYKYMGDMSAFWRMVWQENVGKIVMLTNLSEAGTPKCDQYWPDKDFSQLYADVQVTCQSEEIYADYTVRSFVAQKGSEKRSIAQVHFTAWPDKGVPDDVTSLIEFRQKVNSTKTKLEGPILVHCSAGIGRTGTYIAIDSLTMEGEVEGGVDIYACVRNMREQRVNMVQTDEQYRYLHNAVVHTLTFDSKAIEATQFSEYMTTHNEDHLGEKFKILKGGLTEFGYRCKMLHCILLDSKDLNEQYGSLLDCAELQADHGPYWWQSKFVGFPRGAKLQASVECRPADEIEAVKRNTTLKDKNREGADIPGDRNRPRLYIDRKLGASDYINALYVNSFKSINRYIVAQTPLPETVADFLALIVQEKVSCIIDMESNVTENKGVGAYFPAENQTFKKGTFTVKTEPGEHTDQYIFKKLKIIHNRKSEEITVKHIQFTKWNHKTKIPEEPAQFVPFVKDMEMKYCGGEREGPVLVHCLTGAEKSGLFCVVSILLEKTQIDQEISVVNTVRQIKYRRHMSIPNKEQYIFCHQCLDEYLRSFDTYSNVGLKV